MKLQIVNRKCQPEKYAQILALTLKHDRLAMGISINELSQRSGLSRTSIRQIEEANRIPQVSTLLKFCDGLGTTPATVLLSVEKQLAAKPDPYKSPLSESQEKTLNYIRKRCQIDPNFAAALDLIFDFNQKQ